MPAAHVISVMVLKVMMMAWLNSLRARQWWCIFACTTAIFCTIPRCRPQHCVVCHAYRVTTRRACARSHITALLRAPAHLPRQPTHCCVRHCLPRAPATRLRVQLDSRSLHIRAALPPLLPRSTCTNYAHMPARTPRPRFRQQQRALRHATTPSALARNLLPHATRSLRA